MEPIHGIPPDLVRGPGFGPNEARPMEAAGNWGIAKFGLDALRSQITTKIKLGVVDTGVDRSHPLLQNVKGAKDFTGSRIGADDANGHGTHCTGTVGATDPNIGHCPGFDLYHGKGLSDGGSGGNTLMDAIEYCLSEGAVIVSNSWGGGGQSMEWERRFREWAEHPSKPWLIFAAGNSGHNTPDTDWPGRSQHLFNVGALNPDLSPASFTSAGAKLNSTYAGVNILSCRPARLGGGTQLMSGTSMATPGLAGVLGEYRAGLVQMGMPIPTIYELMAMAKQDSTDTHTPGVDRLTGPGWLTPLLLSLNLVPDPPKVVK
jgi:subtilisin family serine protease